MATSIIRRRPWMSLSLPERGIVTVVAMRYALTTQLSSLNPRSSPTIAGSAVARSSGPGRRGVIATNAIRIWRCVSSWGAAAGAAIRPG